MKQILFFIVAAFLCVGISCKTNGKKSDNTTVTIKTDFGEIVVKLYDDTPEHAKNFMKLVEEGFYDGLLFHRVMNHFMIQGGDPDSKNAQAGSRLGGGSPGYTLPAEFNPKYFHKKGALAAARQGGPSNPEKRSSGSQFYIVHGEIYRPGQLDSMEMSINNRRKNELMQGLFQQANEELNQHKAKQDEVGFNMLVAQIREKADSIYNTSPKFALSDEQKQIYSTIGGYPSLDGEYTVFGEVVEGFDVLDKIAAVEVDQYNRPLADVKMSLKPVK